MLTKASALERLSALSLEQLQTVLAFVDAAMPETKTHPKKSKVKLGVMSDAYVNDDLFDELDADILAVCEDYI